MFNLSLKRKLLRIQSAPQDVDGLCTTNEGRVATGECLHVVPRDNSSEPKMYNNYYRIFAGVFAGVFGGVFGGVFEGVVAGVFAGVFRGVFAGVFVGHNM